MKFAPVIAEKNVKSLYNSTLIVIKSSTSRFAFCFIYFDYNYLGYRAITIKTFKTLLLWVTNKNNSFRNSNMTGCNDTDSLKQVFGVAFSQFFVSVIPSNRSF